MEPSANSPPSQLNLAILVGTIQNAVNAQNLIATNIKALTSGFTGFFATFLADFAAAFPPPISGSVVWDPSSVAMGASTSTTISAPGAALGNFVQVSFSLDLQGMSLTGYVSAADTVTAVLQNNTGGSLDLGSGTVKARVTAQ